MRCKGLNIYKASNTPMLTSPSSYGALWHKWGSEKQSMAVFLCLTWSNVSTEIYV